MGVVRCLVCGSVGHWGRSGRCLSCKRVASRVLEMNPERRQHKAIRYNAAYRRCREMWSRGLEVFQVNCPRCGEPITGEWDLDHQPDGSLHPAHPACNRGKRGE